MISSSPIEFTVEEKPPKKTKPSMWSENNPQVKLVMKLRQKAFEEGRKQGLTKPFHGPVKLTLTIYDPNPLERKDRHDYLGDLDSHVAGVFESLQPSPPENNNLHIDSMFKENNEIRHDIPIIVADDAQIATVLAKKRKDEKTFYTVIIEDDDIENS